MNDSEDKVMKELIEFALRSKYSDIPKNVINFTKILTIKTVSGMLVGSIKPSGRKMAKIIRDRKLPKDVGVIGAGFKTSLWESAFLNAFFAHASELEDDRMIAWGESAQGMSWDITVIPLLFSLIEHLRLSGKTLLETISIGLEIHARTTLFSSDHLGLAFIGGAVGPAIAAAKAMNLDEIKTKNAVGIAIPNSPGSPFNFGMDGHFFESASHSLQGIMAAEMAKEGMTGNYRLGAYLRRVLGEEKVIPEKMVKGLRENWLLCETWIKKYPVCLPLHRHIDALLTLKTMSLT